MNEPLAYFDGRWVPPSELLIPIYDTGFVQGATVTEQLRTFGELFALEEHLARLVDSLAIVGVDPGLSKEELATIAKEAARRQWGLLDPADDVGLGMFVTPGPYPAFAAGAVERRPLVCVHAYPLQFHLWAAKFTAGEHIVISDVEQISSRTWPPELKCRSRIHYFLADRRASAVEPGSRAVLVDRHGFISEATTANVLLYRAGEGLVSPPAEKILPGISLSTIVRLAPQLDIPLVFRDLRPDELESADEVLLTSTSVCVLPVVRANGHPIGNGAPGPIYARLLAAWNELVGLDIAAQAERFASRKAR